MHADICTGYTQIEVQNLNYWLRCKEYLFLDNARTFGSIFNGKTFVFYGLAKFV